MEHTMNMTKAELARACRPFSVPRLSTVVRDDAQVSPDGSWWATRAILFCCAPPEELRPLMTEAAMPRIRGVHYLWKVLRQSVPVRITEVVVGRRLPWVCVSSGTRHGWVDGRDLNAVLRLCKKGKPSLRAVFEDIDPRFPSLETEAVNVLAVLEGSKVIGMVRGCMYVPSYKDYDHHEKVKGEKRNACEIA